MDNLRILAQLVRERSGLEIPPDRLEALRPQLEQLAQPTGWQPYLTSLRQAEIASPILQQVIQIVTIGETFFFRDDAHFEALRNVVFPQLIKAKQEIRILSLGCSTGEEPYSLAILLKQLLHSRSNIVGADISLANLEFARQAVYRPWSFRGVSAQLKNRYFKEHPQGLQLSPEIRALVSFVPLNVVDGIGPYFESLDLIVWRNMSIYFSLATRNRVTLQCQRALRPGGYLLVGASEVGQLGKTQLEPQRIGDTWFYRRLKSPPRSPRSKPVFNDLTQTRQLADRGQYEEARADCLRLLKDGETMEIRYLLAQIDEARGDPESAQQNLLEAVKIDREFVIGHFMLGLDYSRRQNRRKALRHLGRAQEILKGQSAQALVPHSEGRTVADLLEVIRNVQTQ